MGKRGKRYAAAAAKVAEKAYDLAEAVKALKEMPRAKFDESVEISFKLNIDPRKADQVVRGTVVLPRGSGKKVRVLVFAVGPAADQAQAAGADFVGGEDLVEKINKGWLDFDVALANPSMMRHVGKLGKLLGPRGLMPSPKSGTVTENLTDAVKEFKMGKVEFRSDEGGNVHALAGKISFSAEDLATNVQAIVEAVKALRPATVKGNFIIRSVLCSTMSPGVWLAV